MTGRLHDTRGASAVITVIGWMHTGVDDGMHRFRIDAR